jgi:adenylate kinase
VNLLLLGPQGSGKGTQAKKIAQDLGVPHVSTGEMFRALDRASELGREVTAIMKRGELVPDDLTIRMIEERLSEDDALDGFILDGFPRNLAQAEALDAMLAVIGRRLDAILFFDLPDEVALERMSGRVHEEGRSDDTPEAMQRRLEIYHRQTVPVVEHYRATGKLVPLHADRSVDEVAEEIQRALDLFDDDAA